jgi:hypothetical protein
MRVDCDGNTLTVYYPDGTTDPIKATPKDRIVWITTLNALTIADKSNLCIGNTSDLAHTGCIIDANAKRSHTHTASSTDAKCSNVNSSTQTVVLPN